MIVRDIVRSSALILGRNDVVSYLNGENNSSTDTLECVNSLTNLCSLVLNELASTYLPMIRKETVTFVNNRQPFNQLAAKLTRMIAIYDMNGEKVDFSLDDNYILANVGKCIIEYEYSPKNYGLEETIGYSEKQISASVLAYGVASEYSITQGQFEQAVMLHKRFVDCLEEYCVPKNKVIKSRSWV